MQMVILACEQPSEGREVRKAVAPVPSALHLASHASERTEAVVRRRTRTEESPSDIEVVMPRVERDAGDRPAEDRAVILVVVERGRVRFRLVEAGVEKVDAPG